MLWEGGGPNWCGDGVLGWRGRALQAALPRDPDLLNSKRSEFTICSEFTTRGDSLLKM